MFLWREKKHLDILPVKWTPKWPSSSWRVWHLLVWFWVYFLQRAIPKTSSSDSALGPQTRFSPQRLHVLPQQAPVWQLLSPLCHSSPLWSTWSALMCVSRYSWIYVFLGEKNHTDELIMPPIQRVCFLQTTGLESRILIIWWVISLFTMKAKHLSTKQSYMIFINIFLSVALNNNTWCKWNGG